MSYWIEYGRDIEKALDKLPAKDFQRVKVAIDLLAEHRAHPAA